MSRPGDDPPSSRIRLRSTEDHFGLEVPPRGVHLAAAGQVFGGVLCLFICAQWTIRALAESGAAAAWVSAPYWLLGFGVVVRAVYAMVKGHRVEIGPDSGWIRVSPIGRRKPLRTQTLAVRFDQLTRGEADGRGGTEVPVLVFDDGLRVFRLMEGSTEPELRWVRTELNGWLARRSARG